MGRREREYGVCVCGVCLLVRCGRRPSAGSSADFKRGAEFPGRAEKEPRKATGWKATRQFQARGSEATAAATGTSWSQTLRGRPQLQPPTKDNHKRGKTGAAAATRNAEARSSRGGGAIQANDFARADSLRAFAVAERCVESGVLSLQQWTKDTRHFNEDGI
jgi:hypothetical protein